MPMTLTKRELGRYDTVTLPAREDMFMGDPELEKRRKAVSDRLKKAGTRIDQRPCPKKS